MLGFNWVDLLLLVMAILTIYYSRRLGFLTLAGTVVGFFTGLFVGGALFPHLIPIHDRTVHTLINGNLVLCLALYGAVKGNDIGRQGHRKLLPRFIRRFESIIGAALSIVALLALAWLLSAIVGRLPFAGLSNSVDDAFIIQALDHSLPPAPAVFASFNHEITGNGSPYVFEDKTHVIATAVTDNSSPALPQSVVRSAVRVTSFGCGGIISGSGFVVSPDMVITNAHVVAGVKRPIIKTATRSYEGMPVFFDQNLDVAILLVKHLGLTPITLDTRDLTGQSIVAASYPSGNFSEGTGIVRSKFMLYGRNIYDVGVIGRDIYEIQIQAEQGSSGGPILTRESKVGGMLFAKSEIVNGYSYALTAQSLLPAIHRARVVHVRVSTGACLAS